MKKRLTILALSLFVISGCTHEAGNSDPNTQLSVPQMFEPEIAFPDVEGEMVTINGVTFRKIDSLYVFGGDIIMSREQIDTLTLPATKGMFENALTNFWPSGNIYYDFHSNYTSHNTVEAGIRMWTNATDLIFIRSSTAGNRIIFTLSTGNNSKLGCIGCAQTINLSSNAGAGTAAHEIGHALGLKHEGQRSDRDNYINVNYGNIKEGYALCLRPVQ